MRGLAVVVSVEPVAGRLFFWGARALYLGPSFGLAAHRNAAAVLCAGLGGAFGLARDPRLAEPDFITCRTALIPANTLHRIRPGAAPMAFLYVDPQSADYRCLFAGMRQQGAADSRDHGDEAAYLAILARLSRGAAWPDVRDEIAAVLGLAGARSGDERIRGVIRRLVGDPEGVNDLAGLAAGIGLSPSRLQHLFKDETGLAFRRYKLWTRMGAAIRAMARGQALTEAALGAGFASSAHFSSAFRAMFGLTPSAFAKAGLTIVEAPAGQ
ncbi:MAG: helix-turn-helix transcriptional regulator [Rhizobiales bacterium]|nr:helix-turn-helix transcriptional regulator [Hyphomicrobiales bacterium]